MKKILFILVVLLGSLFTTSCTYGQILDDYYDYETNVVVVYRDNVPYYRVWDYIIDGWRYDLVPMNRWSFIRPIPRPFIHRNFGGGAYRPYVGNDNRGSIRGGFTPKGNNQPNGGTRGVSPNQSRPSGGNVGGQQSRPSGGSMSRPSGGGQSSPRGSIRGGFSGGRR